MQDSPDARIAGLEAELAAVRAELQDFVYTVSHDLRADLRHVIAYAQIVEEDAGPQLDAPTRAHLATITGAAQQLGQRIEGLMQLSRLGTVALQAQPVALGSLVPELCAALQTQHAERAITWRIAPDLPVLLADPTLLQQALQQVLGNAVKFSAKQAHTVIEVGTDVGARFWVRDNGAGFNPAFQAKLFHMFQRLHSPREFDGLGVGLAVTRKIAERHGARVWAEGAVDAGCCIRFDWPLAGA